MKRLLSLSGILGSLLMFTGDMLLYYDLVSGLDYDSIATMGKMPVERLIAGGLIGPIAAVFSIMGGYLFYLVFRPVNRILARMLFACFAVMFVVAGSYHAVFASYGFIGRLPEPFQVEQLSFLRTYLKSIYALIFVCGTIWTLLLFYLVIFTKTLYPRWMLLFTPTLLLLLSPYLKDYIPYPFGAIIYGGWINLSFMVYFIVCFLHFSRKKFKSAISNHEL
ncbi:MAG: hypothetical protein HQ565_13675 [Bacteroidetes bacterium]|nr:hypothetical protein [Bacteroidota bacterium]